MKPFALAAVLLTVPACVRHAPGPVDDGLDRNAQLRTFADAIVMPTLERFVTDAAALEAATSSWDASAGADGPAHEAAQEAWRTAMTTWERLEVMQVGPAGATGVVAGGEGARDRIYAWPTVSRCSVDQQLAANAFREPRFAAEKLVNVVGLHTLEQLLFVAALENACPSSSALNANGTWLAIGEPELRLRRSAYAKVIAVDVAARARALRDAWKGGFRDALANAGTGLYTDPQAALDDVFAGLFYVELRTKDRKLAEPAGLHVDCEADTCPGAVESPFAQRSAQHIEQNLVAARQIFLGLSEDGVDGPGFDDLLRARSADELAAQMTTEIEAALVAVRALDGKLEAVLATEPDRVRAAHAALKRFTDLLKSQFVSVLNVRVPAEGAGDND